MKDRILLGVFLAITINYGCSSGPRACRAFLGDWEREDHRRELSISREGKYYVIQYKIPAIGLGHSSKKIVELCRCNEGVLESNINSSKTVIHFKKNDQIFFEESYWKRIK